MRTERDLRETAAKNGLRLVQVERVPMGGRMVMVGRMTFTDPWAAARFLDDESTEDASDPYVRGYSLALLKATARANGLSMSGPTRSPELLELYARAIHANVQRQIEFVNEPTETFQSARETLQIGAGDCDDHARLVKALALAGNLPAKLVFFEADAQPVHVVSAMRPGRIGPWRWAETTIGAAYGEHPYHALERLEVELGENPMAHDTPAVEGMRRRMSLRGVGFLGLDFVTAQNVRDYKTQLDGYMVSLDGDVAKCSTIPETKRAAWTDFYQGWKTFLADDPSWYDSGAQGRQAAQFAAELQQWQKDMKTLCPVSAPTVPTTNSDDKYVSAAKTVAISVAVAAVAVAAVKFAPARRSA